MDSTDAAIRMTAFTLAEGIINGNKEAFPDVETIEKFIKDTYQWLKEAKDMGEVVKLERIQ